MSNLFSPLTSSIDQSSETNVPTGTTGLFAPLTNQTTAPEQQASNPMAIQAAVNTIPEPKSDIDFSGTKQDLTDIKNNPFSIGNVHNIPEDIKSSFGNAWEGLKSSWEGYKAAANPNVGFAGKLGSVLKLAGGAAGLAFSPITALFKGGEDIPIVGTAVKGIDTAFSAAGEGASSLGKTIIDKLPIQNKIDKQALKEGVGDIFALAAQIALGKGSEIAIKNIKAKYSPVEAQTIIDKAHEIAPSHPEAGSLPKKEDFHAIADQVKTKVVEPVEKPVAKVEEKPNEETAQNVTKENVSKISNLSENSLENNLGGVKEKSVQYFKDNPTEITKEPIRVREVDGKLTVEDGRHRLQAAKEAGIDDLKVIDVTGNYEKGASSKILNELGIKSTPEVVKVPGEQLPVGEGEIKISKLEARIKDKLGKMTPEEAEAAGISTYKKMNVKENLTKSAEFVSKDPQKALRALEGKEELPEGLTYGGVAIAAEAHAELVGSADLISKLASLRGTRYGQEIRILAEADPLSITSQTQQIQIAREEAVQKSLGKRKTTTKARSEIVEKGKKVVKDTKLKLEDAQKLLDSLIC